MPGLLHSRCSARCCLRPRGLVNRPWRKGSRRNAVLALAAGVFGPGVNVSFQLGRLEFQFPRDVFADAIHRAATAGADFFFIRQVVLVVDLPQLIPIDLAPLAAAMAFDFGSLAWSGEVFRFVGRRRPVLRSSPPSSLLYNFQAACFVTFKPILPVQIVVQIARWPPHDLSPKSAVPRHLSLHDLASMDWADAYTRDELLRQTTLFRWLSKAHRCVGPTRAKEAAESPVGIIFVTDAGPPVSAI